MGVRIPGVPKPTVQFIKVNNAAVPSCNSCGATVEPELQQRHRQWHRDNNI